MTRSLHPELLRLRLDGAHVTEQDWDERGVTEVRVYGTDSAGHADAVWEVGNDAAGRLVSLVGPISGADVAMEATHTYDSRGRLAGVAEAGLAFRIVGCGAGALAAAGATVVGGIAAFDSAVLLASLGNAKRISTEAAAAGAGYTALAATIIGTKVGADILFASFLR